MHEVELLIDKPAAGGRMIARLDGRIVLVAGAIPGERVRARIERRRPGLAYASVVDVLEPDPDRQRVEGEPACGGRAYAHIAYERQLTLKAEIVRDALTRIGKVAVPPDVPVAPSPIRGYRMRARLHVQGMRVGFFRERTHTLCDAASTGQFLPETSVRLSEIGAALGRVRSRVETLDLIENVAGTARALHLELPPGSPVSGAELGGLLQIEGVSGATASPGRAAPPHVRGTPFVSDSIDAFLEEPSGRGDVRLRRHAASFFQGNRYLVPRMVGRVIEAVRSAPVADLYAGVGLFAVSLAAVRQTPVAAVENDALSAHDLAANAEALAGAVRVHRMTVEAFLAESRPARGTTIVNPPRPGLSREVTSALARWSPARIIYVSCDPATLARDVRRLSDGGYRLRSTEAFDLFPETPHIEALAILEKP